MDDSAMKITQESWAMVEREIPNWTDIFYDKMFSDPNIAKLFPFSAGDFKTNEKFQTHTQKVRDTMHTAMTSIREFEKLGPVLKKMGERHADYGVIPEHSVNFKEAFLHTLKTGYGDKWNEDLDDAWNQCVDALLEPFEDGLNEALAAKNQ
ncbi:hypothetical protein PTSG_10302 [Salpingoeca rosetta]|uniref:Globin domain-containing protein n=1 Tax=Salpingoeca rosetta (strain ATCC 50818 / BSB-021) TaxID=946362 RepID=F2UQX2_SALR5|nr:uncharacterized protein PTSG_10302 [Salpingoeca rosetta]EGD80027.1 hypothetical protein PTSG_10302 [Salpingoeca rosetta]|eukprot:XP_004988352.1 hypothetical protein PTSG_10302 [Salpingoeca rosetta]